MNDVIGIVGLGFVGNAVADFFDDKVTVLKYDVDPAKRNVESYAELVARTSIIFVAVPTPMRADGSCDASIVAAVIDHIDVESVKQTRDTTVILKSTVLPGSTTSLQTERVEVIFNPEFLTEANARLDFKHQDRIVFGRSDVGERLSRHESNWMLLRTMHERYFPRADILHTTSEAAELLKYATNTFLALKVAFANEMYHLSAKSSVQYPELVRLLKQDDRLGKSHWQVPGPDGKYGFGGTCFPKDVNALITYGLSNGVNMGILQAAWDKNLLLRPERDWEQLKGRAVVGDVEDTR